MVEKYNEAYLRSQPNGEAVIRYERDGEILEIKISDTHKRGYHFDIERIKENRCQGALELTLNEDLRGLHAEPHPERIGFLRKHSKTN